MDLDVSIKLHVYEQLADTGRAPRRAEIARALALKEEDVRGAFDRLRQKRLLFLARDSGEIVMAPPFSAVPTTFRVTSGGTTWFANCVWDAFGIPAALHRAVEVSASCACCGEPIVFPLNDGPPSASTGVAHFAVPAAHWWDDLVYT
jgi:alkylmercury lyase-like protein